ncbi:MAG: hypothetical protein JNK82_18920 [Myxococcaceae bacterium]|nr:hypothetical protein [Myxococcaceae bacterium]
MRPLRWLVLGVMMACSSSEQRDTGFTSCPSTYTFPDTGPCSDSDLTCRYGQESCCGFTFSSVICSCDESGSGDGLRLWCRYTDACLEARCPDAG